MRCYSAWFGCFDLLAFMHISPARRPLLAYANRHKNRNVSHLSYGKSLGRISCIPGAPLGPRGMAVSENGQSSPFYGALGLVDIIAHQ